jgi:hypothetical protein
MTALLRCKWSSVEVQNPPRPGDNIFSLYLTGNLNPSFRSSPIFRRFLPIFQEENSLGITCYNRED